MMGDLIEIDGVVFGAGWEGGADLVFVADEFFLDIPGEVAAIEELEIAELEEECDASGVVGVVDG